ncbi:MAG: hypothetical protein ACK57Q_05525 [Planctomycetota bacterium]|jgi:hypothetical protein
MPQPAPDATGQIRPHPSSAQALALRQEFIDEIRLAAARATPGPWGRALVSTPEEHRIGIYGTGLQVCVLSGGPKSAAINLVNTRAEHDAHYLRTVSPDRVLKLLDDLAALANQVELLQDLVEELRRKETQEAKPQETLPKVKPRAARARVKQRPTSSRKEAAETMTESPWLTIAECSRIARCERRTIFRWVSEYRFETSRPVAAGSARRLVDRRSFLAFLAGESDRH